MGPTPRQPKILIVEDQPIARRLLLSDLAERGMDLREAASVEEALAALDQCPDAVVLDLFLPGGSGLDIARALRSNPRTRNAGIIALSAHSAFEYQERAAAAGCDVYLVKPCTPEQLVDAIETTLAAKCAELIACTTQDAT